MPNASSRCSWTTSSNHPDLFARATGLCNRQNLRRRFRRRLTLPAKLSAVAKAKKKPPAKVAFYFSEELLLGRLSSSGSSGGSGSSSRSRSVSSRSGSSSRSSDGSRSGSFFFFATSGQSSSSDHGCQNESFVHVELPEGLKTISGNCQRRDCIDQVERIAHAPLSLGLYGEISTKQIFSRKSLTGNPSTAPAWTREIPGCCCGPTRPALAANPRAGRPGYRRRKRCARGQAFASSSPGSRGRLENPADRRYGTAGTR